MLMASKENTSGDYSRNSILLQALMGKIQKQIRKKKEYKKYRGALALGRDVCKKQIFMQILLIGWR